MLRSILRLGARTLGRRHGPYTCSKHQLAGYRSTTRHDFNHSRRPSPPNEYVRAESASPLSLSELAGFLDASSYHAPHDASDSDSHVRDNGESTGRAVADSEEADDFDIDDDPDSSLFPQQMASVTKTSVSDPAAAREELYAALTSKNPIRLLNATVTAFEHETIIDSLSPIVVHEIFRSLDLESIVMRYHEISRQLSPTAIAKATKAGSPIRQVPTALEALYSSFAKVVRQWERDAKDVSVPIYKALLRLCGLIGDASSARTLRNMMKKHGHGLDLDSTNSYIRALCWDNSYGRNYVMTRLTTTIRESSYSPGYRLSMKDEAFQAFNELRDNGHSANTETFSLLALAMGRVGNLNDVANLLKRTWDIDVPGVLEGNMDALLFDNDLQPTNALYPNEEVMFNLAHIYGTNNRFSDALRLVDYISQRYSMPIPLKVWEELARWCFVLSRPRPSVGTSWRGELNTHLQQGHVKSVVMEELWATMQSQPHCITPSLEMWGWRLKTLWRRRRTPHKWMAAFRSLVHELQLEKVHFPHTRNFSPKALSEGSANAAAISIEHELSLLDELVKATFTFRWLRLHLRVGAFTTSFNRFIYGDIPNTVDQYKTMWFQCTNRAMHYPTRTGRIDFHRNMQEERPRSTEVFPIGKGFKLALPTKHSVQLPFVENTYSQRRNEIAELRWQEGETGPGKARPAWYEGTEVGDWIWFPDGTGALLHGGRFQGSRKRRFRVPAESLEHLNHDQRYSLQKRLMRPDPFFWKNFSPGQASAEPSPNPSKAAVVSAPAGS